MCLLSPAYLSFWRAGIKFHTFFYIPNSTWHILVIDLCLVDLIHSNDKYFCNCKYLILYACIWYTWGSKCRKMPDEELEGKSEETLLGLGLNLKLNDSFCLFVCFVWFVCFFFLFLFLEWRPQQNFKKTAWSNSHLKLVT